MQPLGWPGAPLASAYRAGMALRNLAFARGWRRVHRLAVPVVSIGNLSAGGTGKTPLVERVVSELAAAGHRPAILLRGYGAPGLDGAADEVTLLRENCPGVPVVPDPDRVRGAAQALAQGASVCVLDDGFQHRRVARDLDLVCVDATADPFRDHLIPWGRLREPPASLGRAHAIVVTRADQVADGGTALIARLAARAPGRPVWRARHAPVSLLSTTGPELPAGLARRPVYVACGVGNPAAVRATVAGLGADVCGFRPFPDHHAWTGADLGSVQEAAGAAGATAIIVTQKDWVKVRALGSGPLPVMALRVGLALEDGGIGLRALLAALPAAPAATSRPPR